MHGLLPGLVTWRGMPGGRLGQPQGRVQGDQPAVQATQFSFKPHGDWRLPDEDIKLNKESDAVSSKHTLQKTKKHFIMKFERQSKPSEEKGDQCM